MTETYQRCLPTEAILLFSEDITQLVARNNCNKTCTLIQNQLNMMTEPYNSNTEIQR
jgi:hypothetical protein